MTSRTAKISTLVFTATAIVLCPALSAGSHKSGQTEQNPEQKAPASQGPVMEPDPSVALMEKGFQRLYELNFNGARVEFLAYQKSRPDDPLGKAVEAASYLFEQFNAKGVLTSEFFLSDAKFLGGVEGAAAQNQNAAFMTANSKAREMAKTRLKSNPRDIHGLLAITIADGMESDYDALIIKKQLDGLKMMKQAESEANILRTIDPSQQDANVALGMSNYVIGCLPGYKRAFVWLGGVYGDC